MSSENKNLWCAARFAVDAISGAPVLLHKELLRPDVQPHNLCGPVEIGVNDGRCGAFGELGIRGCFPDHGISWALSLFRSREDTQRAIDSITFRGAVAYDLPMLLSEIHFYVEQRDNWLGKTKIIYDGGLYHQAVAACVNRAYGGYLGRPTISCFPKKAGLAIRRGELPLVD